MSKLDKFPDAPRPQGRTAHDMSHDFKFTCANGQLLPVEHDLLLPGDTAYLKFHFFGRNTFPFLAPAMVDIDFHVDYFFVPMQMLYTPFGSFIEGINDTYSSNFYNWSPSAATPIGIKWLPLLNITGMRDTIWDNRDKYNLSSVFSNAKGNHYECLGREYCRLMDMLGFNPELRWQQHYNPQVFPYSLLAYQAIYQHYYRLEDKQTFSPLYNFDRFAHINIPSLDKNMYDLVFLRYRPANFDYFNSVKKSPLLNEQNLAQSIQHLQSANDASILNAVPSFLQSEKFIGDSGLSPFQDAMDVSPLGVAEYNNAFQSVNSLRTAFALDKLLQVTARARKNYDSQVLAHFGFKVPHDVKHELTHIGHETATMHIGQVMSLGSPDELGTRAGEGTVNLKSKGIKFTAPCHGVLMVIFSAAVRYDYEVPFLRKNFIQNRLDFFTPEFDHLGMQPLFAFETTKFNVTNADDEDGPNVEFATAVQGWQYRYTQFKRGINRLSHAFSWKERESEGSVAGQTLMSYVAWMRPFHGEHFGFFYNPVAATWDSGNFQYDTSEYAFVARPEDTNMLFATTYSPDWPVDDNDNPRTDVEQWELYARDPFVIASRIDYKKVSIMSTYSMPKLD